MVIYRNIKPFWYRAKNGHVGVISDSLRDSRRRVALYDWFNNYYGGAI